MAGGMVTNIGKDFMQGGLNMEGYACMQKTCKFSLLNIACKNTTPERPLLLTLRQLAPSVAAKALTWRWKRLPNLSCTYARMLERS